MEVVPHQEVRRLTTGVQILLNELEITMRGKEPQYLKVKDNLKSLFGDTGTVL